MADRDETGSPPTSHPDRDAEPAAGDGSLPLEVRSEPVEAEDGSTVVIAQQNAGPGNQVGGGEFKAGATGRSVQQAAEEQAKLQREAPVEGGSPGR